MITKEMTIGEVISENPKKAEILLGFGMGCVGCPSSQVETIAEAAVVHRINLVDLLNALNKKDL